MIFERLIWLGPKYSLNREKKGWDLGASFNLNKR